MGKKSWNNIVNLAQDEVYDTPPFWDPNISYVVQIECTARSQCVDRKSTCMEGRMSGYDTDDILSEALDLAEKEDENIFITHSSFQKYEDKGTYFIILSSLLVYLKLIGFKIF
jgi:hypothetical protein